MGQDRQFLGRITAVDIKCWVRFRETKTLSFQNDALEGCLRFFHFGHDVVARAIEDRLQGLDLVGRKALTDVGDDGDTTGNRGLEGDGPAQLPGSIEKLGTKLSEQGLVGRDHIFPALKQFHHDRAGRFKTSNELGDYLDGWVIQDVGEGIGQNTVGEGNISGLR